jgi:hypothetical protein
MSAPDKRAPYYFGMSGMAAALGITEGRLRIAYKTGDIAAPDTVHDGEPRWSVFTLADELKKHRPATLPAQGLAFVVWALEALTRAERAEGLHGGPTT